jgi:hypothetical protein
METPAADVAAAEALAESDLERGVILWSLELNDDGAMTDLTEGLQHRAAGRYQEAAAVYEAGKNKRSEEHPRGLTEWDEDTNGTTQSEALRRERDHERQWREEAGPREQEPESPRLGEDNPTLLRFYNCRHSCGHEFMSETIRVDDQQPLQVSCYVFTRTSLS